LASSLPPNEQAAGNEWALRLMDNIRALGPAVNAMTIAEHQPGYGAQFAKVVANNFANLGDPSLALDSDERGSLIQQRAEPALSCETLSWSPRVFRIPCFADVQERLFLLAASVGSLIGPQDQTPLAKGEEVDPFDGQCAVFSPPLISPIVRIIQRRWAKVLHVSEQHFEPMSILRYDQGHEYSPHVDFFDSNRIAAHRQVGDLGGQRLITGLIYLIAAERGGETCYANHGPQVTGADGDAVFHFNTTVNGLPDLQSVHQGKPVTAGEKWLCRTAVRENNLYLHRETVL